MSKRLDYARAAFDAAAKEPNGVKQALYFQNSIAQSLLGILECMERAAEGQEAQDSRQSLAESVALYKEDGR